MWDVVCDVVVECDFVVCGGWWCVDCESWCDYFGDCVGVFVGFFFWWFCMDVVYVYVCELGL